jgi:catechol 2,3-dioxygenase-like lactoylglutathione lyase family enzyme
MSSTDSAVNLEVVTVPVSDVDGAKAFYSSLGWRLDADIAQGEDFRVVQFTPPRSACSVAFGQGLTTGEPGSVRRLILAVDNIDSARDDLVSRGVEVSGLFHLDGGRAPGRDPQGGSYQTYAAFSDPDGNEWLLQEITTRFPGRVWDDSAASPRWPACSTRPPSITTRTRSRTHRTTGGTGTRPT